MIKEVFIIIKRFSLIRPKLLYFLMK